MRFSEMTEVQRNYVRTSWYQQLNDIIERFHMVQMDYEELYQRLHVDETFQNNLRCNGTVETQEQVKKHLHAITMHLFHLSASLPTDLTGLLHDFDYDETVAQEFPC